MTYVMYVDGGGNAGTPTYISTKLKKNGRTLKNFGMSRFYLENLLNRNDHPRSDNFMPFLPDGCQIVDGKGEGTNNIAEYAALYYGLVEFRRKYGEKPIQIYHDSQLVVRQVLTRLVPNMVDVEYRCKSPHLLPWLEAVALVWWDNIIYQHIKRGTIVKELGH